MIDNWISVEERLPENDDYVMVYDNDDILMARYNKGEWEQYDLYETVYLKPTHWMPLPQPPKAENKMKKDPNADLVNVVRCAECRWRPEYGVDHNGKISHAPEHLKFPIDENMEEVCPCSIGDWYYSWMPADDFFCKKGERKAENKSKREEQGNAKD